MYSNYSEKANFIICYILAFLTFYICTRGTSIWVFVIAFLLCFILSEHGFMHGGDFFSSSFFGIWKYLCKYYNYLPNDWSEFKLDRPTHGLSLNLTGWCYFKSQRHNSQGVYMLVMLQLYQWCQNGVLCTESISLQVPFLGFEPMTYTNTVWAPL